MRSIATDVTLTRSVVCVSVCWWHWCIVQKPTEMPFGGSYSCIQWTLY